MDAWRTSCPRLAVWDDAIADGLVTVVMTPGGAGRVALTDAGTTLLASAASARSLPVSSPAA